MASQAEIRHWDVPPYPRKRRSRGRRKNTFMVYATALMLVAALLVGAGALCWKGAKLLWLGAENILGGLLPESPGLVTAPETTEADREAPVLAGVRDLTVYQGDTIAYLSGVTATDDRDPAPVVTVDSSAVDLSRPGVYSVVYTATDASGNASREQAAVSVMEKQAGYVDLDTIYALADDLLAIILEGTADTRQQVEAIYRWARTDIRYAGHSDRTDWRQTAYNVIRAGEGDCFGYFAATKLMFERLGIPNVDVRKVKNHEGDSDHFWSLVSVDGEHYYHFDATPRYGDGDDFCLVTDAFLDAYSDAHEGSHNRDRSLYPETP